MGRQDKTKPPSAPAADPASGLDWHALEPSQVLKALDVQAQQGLSAQAAAQRLREHGENRLPAAHARPAWRRLLLQFHNPLIYVLLVAGTVTLALEDRVDSAVIFAVVLINTLIGFVQEGKAERALDAVRNMLASRATVLRDGQRQSLPAEQLVPGDLVLLEPGDKVPADLRLVHSKTLRMTEAALTGESVPVDKSSAAVAPSAVLGERTGMAYAGTLVAMGQATGVVVATGTHTEIGRIGAMVGELQSLTTPLTQRLDQFARQISAFIVGVGLLTYLYGVFIADLPTMDLFLAVVGLAVAAIPEGLPAIVTIVLAIGTRTMARNRAIIRRLPAVETLGSVSVICSDKTGTLTRNEMTAVRLELPGRQLQIRGSGYAPEGGFVEADATVDASADPQLQAVARCAMLCNDAELRQDAQGQWALVGDPTEGALLTLAHKAGLSPDSLDLRYLRLDAVPFESERRYMAVLVHDHEGQRRILLKGAPEVVLALCPHDSEGHALNAALWHERVQAIAAEGQRVLALAECTVDAHTASIGLEDITPRFALLGLVGIIDPPRNEAIAAVADCQRAGIRVKMITGDHAVTAAAIGRALGLSTERTLTGDVIEHLDDDTLQREALQTDVIARASPEHKLRLVAALQAQGHLVAMTGDGVNDAPALKSANIGVAMGGKGTDAAREASDLVLTDDNFATIALAVREGRVVFDNIKKSLLFILPTNGGEAGVIVLAILAGVAMPITAGQILWVNLVTAVTLALALAFEPGERGVMRQAPRPTHEALLTRTLLARIAFVSLLMIVSTFVALEWSLARGDTIEQARTTAVNMMAFCELSYLYQARHFTRSALRLETLTGNPVALWVSGLLISLQLMLTYAPPLQLFFRTAAIDASAWGLIVLLSLGVFLLVEIEKALWRQAGVRRL